MKKVVEATPTLVNTIKKANEFFNSSNEFINQTPSRNSNEVSITSNSLESIPCVISSGTSVDGYEVQIFGNGLSKPATGTGTMFLMNGRSSLYNLPPGTVLFAHKSNIKILGNE